MFEHFAAWNNSQIYIRHSDFFRYFKAWNEEITISKRHHWKLYFFAGSEMLFFVKERKRTEHVSSWTMINCKWFLILYVAEETTLLGLNVLDLQKFFI